jgi:hypothetical protein
MAHAEAAAANVKSQTPLTTNACRVRRIIELSSKPSDRPSPAPD